MRLVRGDRERAKELLEDVLAKSREAGYRSAAASALNGLGELARFSGNAERACSCYREYRDVARNLNRPFLEARALLNLTMAEVSAGRLDDAADHIEECVRGLEETGQKEGLRHTLRLIRASLAAGRGDWSRFDELFEPFAEGWLADAPVKQDQVWLLERCAEFAEQSNKIERLRGCLSLAADRWEALGDEEAAREAKERREQLD